LDKHDFDGLELTWYWFDTSFRPINKAFNVVN
jgi:hypothetical protein